jgi:hypothetical protein
MVHCVGFSQANEESVKFVARRGYTPQTAAESTAATADAIVAK